jgi:AcrR family transcriptional regulator
MADAVDLTGDANRSESAPRVDGRRASRERNRLAVVDALLDLYAEGTLRPNADEVALRSGVSRRSVFRYFDDRDDLDRTAIERQQQRVLHLVDIPGIGEGEFEARLRTFTEHRVALYEAIRPAARVSRLRAPFHSVIAEELEASRRLFTRQVERQFGPELDAMPALARTETLTAADALASFEAYDLLCARGLGSVGIIAVLRRGLSALFA